MHFYYTLDADKNVVPVDRHSPEFINLWDIDKRRVAESTVGDFWISTVFLPLDHRLSDEGPPVVFETMVFDQSKRHPIGTTGALSNGEDVWQERCCTWAEALEMHKRAVDGVKAGTIPAQ